MPIVVSDIRLTRPVLFSPSSDLAQIRLSRPDTLPVEMKAYVDLRSLPNCATHAYLLTWRRDPPAIDALAVWDGLTVAALRVILGASYISTAERVWPEVAFSCGHPGAGQVLPFTEVELLELDDFRAAGKSETCALVGCFSAPAIPEPDHGEPPEACLPTGMVSTPLFSGPVNLVACAFLLRRLVEFDVLDWSDWRL